MNVQKLAKGCLAVVLLIFSGCAHDIEQSKDGPQVIGNEQTTLLICWFVEDNGAGKRGYAVIDGLAGYQPADGGGLFSTISSLQKDLRTQRIRPENIMPQFGGKIPRGWKIRNLTPEKLRILESTQ